MDEALRLPSGVGRWPRLSTLTAVVRMRQLSPLGRREEQEAQAAADDAELQASVAQSDWRRRAGLA